MTREWVSAVERDVMDKPNREAIERMEHALAFERRSLVSRFYRVPAPDDGRPRNIFLHHLERLSPEARREIEEVIRLLLDEIRGVGD